MRRHFARQDGHGGRAKCRRIYSRAAPANHAESRSNEEKLRHAAKVANMDGKQLARQIFLLTLEALDVSASVSRCVSSAAGLLRCDKAEYQLYASDLRVIAVGKAAHGMVDGDRKSTR